MKRKWNNFFLLCLICYVIVSSILLFSRGFLLTRTVQDINSTCNKAESKTAPCSNRNRDCINLVKPLYSLNADQFICTPPLAKVILIIIDALRYDFTLFNGSNINPLPYQNKLPIIETILDSYPNSSRLYKFVADPPTTTMQRLKALTTGSLPTFIDAGSNFASQEIGEDNIIDQINRNNYNAIFMGDDTWTALYPNRFLRQYPYPSFDVWDLDTVDNGIKAHIFNEMERTDWNLLVAHFLGVDHCGHKYGPNHIEMARKLTEMNILIEKIIDKMDNDTILFVIGDHGMTITGDHGGESPDEVEAALFIYSKNQLFPVNENSSSTVKQVDIVPTLSVILGVPIPYQNLGILIPESLPLLQNTSNYIRLPLFWWWINAQQVFTYIQSYSKTSSSNSFDKRYLDFCDEKYHAIFNEIDRIASFGAFQQFSSIVKDFILKMRNSCEEIWIQFDNLSINFSLLFLFCSLFFIFAICDSIQIRNIEKSTFIPFFCLALLFCTLIIIATMKWWSYLNLSNSFIFIANLATLLVLSIPVLRNGNFFNFIKPKNKQFYFSNLLSKSILLLSAFGLFSNSFINEESYTLYFLMATFVSFTFGSVVVFSFEKLRQFRSRKPFIILHTFLIKSILISVSIFALLRVSLNFFRCRSEQQWCFIMASNHLDDVTSRTIMEPKYQWIITSVALIVLISINKIWLKQCGNLSGYAVTPFLARILPFVNAICISGYWVAKNFLTRGERKFIFLPLSVYFLTIIPISLLIIKPICTTIIWRDNLLTTGCKNLPKNTIPNVYKKLKKSLNKIEDIPIIYGLGTTYSAAYLTLLNYLIPLFSLLLSDSHACSFFISIVLVGFFLVIIALMRIRHAKTIEDLFNVPDLAIIIWSILSQYFFYATGHQPAFSNIRWDAAFIGTTGLIRNRYILGFLIILNTFNSYILMGLLLPLLIIIPFTLLIMCPSSSFVMMYNRRKGLTRDSNNDSAKGEMLLYENEQLLSTCLFTISCKYIGIQCIKVIASMLAASLHRRHLMVWNIFAPKFIFESVALFATVCSVLLSNLFFIRINTAVKKMIGQISKSSY